MGKQELKPCPFHADDWCDDFDGPCARSKGNRCEVYEQLKKRDNRISELEDLFRELELCASIHANGNMKQRVLQIARQALAEKGVEG